MSRTITVGLGTKSEIKVNAVKRAFDQVFGSSSTVVTVQTCAAVSGINDQPVGFPETILGATNRLTHTKHLLTTVTCDYFVAIENGIIQTGDATQTCPWVDVAWIIVEDAKSSRQYASTSAGIPFATKYVEAARDKGFAKTTAGDVMAQDLKCNTKDPHAFLTHNKVTREQLLQQAVVVALGQSFVTL